MHHLKMAEKPSDRQSDFSYLPDKLQARLMPFQRDGILFGIHKQGRCLIADEMGLGKTLQALALAYYYREEWPLLIIVPASLRYPWVEEIEKWFPDIDPARINLICSGVDVSDIPHSLITVISYGLLQNCRPVVHEALQNQKFKVIIADESHKIKNDKAKSTKFVVPLVQQANRRLLLTGTPALARPVELFPQVSAICPGQFGSWFNFTKRYCDAHKKYFGKSQGMRWYVGGASNLHELEQRLKQSVMIRRLKKDVLTQLPPKTRQRIPFEIKDSAYTKEITSLQDELDQAMSVNKMTLQDSLGSTDTGTPGGFAVCNLASKLYVATCKAKVGSVKEYIRLLCDNENLKFLVFAYHHFMMNGIQETLHDQDVKFIRIDGSVPVKERQHQVHQFQSDPNIRVAILGMTAAGEGLTLTSASLVVFAELYWTPGTLEQCEDRAHRIGQKNAVHIHYLVAKGTIDEWMWRMISRKTSVVTTTLNGRTQVLRADDNIGTHTSLMASAEAWVPSENNGDRDYFLSQELPSSQKTIIDFFSPGNANAKTEKRIPKAKEKVLKMKFNVNDVGELDTHDSSRIITLDKNSKSAGNSEKGVKVIELLESDDELPDLKISPVKKKSRKRVNKEAGQGCQDVKKKRKIMKPGQNLDTDSSCEITREKEGFCTGNDFTGIQAKDDVVILDMPVKKARDTCVRSELPSCSYQERDHPEMTKASKHIAEPVNNSNRPSNKLEIVGGQGDSDSEDFVCSKKSKRQKKFDRKSEKRGKSDIKQAKKQNMKKTLNLGLCNDNLSEMELNSKTAKVEDAQQTEIIVNKSNDASSFENRCDLRKMDQKDISPTKKELKIKTVTHIGNDNNEDGLEKTKISRSSPIKVDKSLSIQMNQNIPVTRELKLQTQTENGTSDDGAKLDDVSIKEYHNDEKQWQCSVCTLLNQNLHLCCMVCRSPRNHGKFKDGDIDNGNHNRNSGANGASPECDNSEYWNCAKCTLQNPSFRKRCMVCFSPGPNVKKKRKRGSGACMPRKMIAKSPISCAMATKRDASESENCATQQVDKSELTMNIQNDVKPESASSAILFQGINKDQEMQNSPLIREPQTCRKGSVENKAVKTNGIVTNLQCEFENEASDNDKSNISDSSQHFDENDAFEDSDASNNGNRERNDFNSHTKVEKMENKTSVLENASVENDNTFLSKKRDVKSIYQNDEIEITEFVSDDEPDMEKQKNSVPDNTEDEACMSIEDGSQDLFESQNNAESVYETADTKGQTKYSALKFITSESEINAHLQNKNGAKILCKNTQICTIEGASKDINTDIHTDIIAAKYIFSPNKKTQSEVDLWECSECRHKNLQIDTCCDECFTVRPKEKEPLEECGSNEPENEQDAGISFNHSEAWDMEVDDSDLMQLDELSVLPESDSEPQSRVVNLDELPVYNKFLYYCSKNTNRVYLHDQEGNPLSVNFTPIDIDIENLDEIPDLLLHPQNFKLVQRFVREWNSLSTTKQRIVIKHSQLFVSPLWQYDFLKSVKNRSSTQRYRSKDDIAEASNSAAQKIGGATRVITRPELPKRNVSKHKSNSGNKADNDGKGFSDNGVSCSISSESNSLEKNSSNDVNQKENKSNSSSATGIDRGFVQAVNANGIPLCLHCQQPYENSLLKTSTMASSEAAWDTRFCKRECKEQFWMKTSRNYGRDQVFEVERGVCQQCGINAHEFYLRIKNTVNLPKRAELIKKSKYSSLTKDVKEMMVKKPVPGQFWHVDHIKAVFEGGGQCDLDNLQTLCSVCHKEVTREQLRNRAKAKQLQRQANEQDITAFFKPSQ